MIVHLVQDEKFIDDFIDQYSATHREKEVRYVVWTRAHKNEITSITSDLVEAIKIDTSEWYLFIDEVIKNGTVVYLHGFHYHLDQTILLFPSEIKVCWIFYGYGFYITPLYQQILDSGSTYYHVGKIKEKRLWSRYVPSAFMHYYYRFKEATVLHSRSKAFARIDIFYHWNEYDHTEIKKYIPSFAAEFVPFAYTAAVAPTNNDYVGELPYTFDENDTVVLVGNSATPTNNHISALEILAKINVSRSIKILCPLNYGDLEYGALVAKKGLELFGESFIPMTQYMSKDEYFSLFKRVDVVVMNQIRTQGAGNVIFALNNGKKVFMHPQNTQYRQFKEDGYIVYDNSILLNSVDTTFEPLTEAEIGQNKIKCGEWIDKYESLNKQML